MSSSNPNDSKWQNSPVHQLFLLTFLQPRTAEDYPNIPSLLPYATWEEALGEDPLRTTAYFQELGVIVPASLSEHLDYGFTKDELQQMLRRKGLTTSGDKADLIARLIKADKETMQSEVNLILLKCSDLGQQVANKYWENPQIVDDDKKISVETLREAVKWILVAAIGGVIGNRADDAFVTFVNYFIEQRPAPTVTPQPTDTPQPRLTPTIAPQPTDTPQPPITPQPTSGPRSSSVTSDFYFPTFGRLASQEPTVISDGVVVLSGAVRDVDTKTPIATALVTCKRTFSYFHPHVSAWTFTNDDGRYRLRAMIHDTDSYVLEVSATRYRPTSLRFGGLDLFRQRTIDIELHKWSG